MPPPEIRPLAEADLAACGRLLAARHAGQRRVEPLLDPRYEDPASAASEVRALTELEGASGVVAVAGGDIVGYLIGFPKNPEVWRPNVWVEAAGHAAADPEVVRDLYAAVAASWVAEGMVAHYAIVPATDVALVDAWFGLGFGQQHTHAIREPPAEPMSTGVVAVRRAVATDIPVLATLDLSLTEHQTLSPVFSGSTLRPLVDLVAEWEEDIDDPRSVTFVAEVDGDVVGSAVGCSIELSSAHAGVSRPDGAGFLAFAAVLPAARGRGVGTALGEAVLDWAAGAGYRSVVTDWRATNLLSSRAWPALGFRPTFLRLHRGILTP